METIHNLTYELAQTIGLSILNGSHWESTSFLTTKALSEKHQVSLNTVREAVRILDAKGLLSTKKRSGISVSPVEKWNLFDNDVLNWISISKNHRDFFKEICELRLAIEPEAARLAANNSLTAEKATCFRQSLRQISCAAPASNEMLKAELDFHKAVLLTSENPYFIQMEKILNKAIPLKFSLLNSSNIKLSSVSADYHLLFEAISTQRADIAHQIASQLARRDHDLSKSLIKPRAHPAPSTEPYAHHQL